MIAKEMMLGEMLRQKSGGAISSVAIAPSKGFLIPKTAPSNITKKMIVERLITISPFCLAFWVM